MRHAVLAFAFVLVSCAHLHPQGLPTWPGALDLSAPADSDTEVVSERFADAVASRFGADPVKEAVKRDLSGQGFSCRDVPPVEARSDYLLAECEASRPRGSCAETWTVSLRFAGQAEAPDAMRVRPVGSFNRHCEPS